ncbi:MAG: Spy/CpxP family protein refolding chaperone [Azonexus sp.]
MRLYLGRFNQAGARLVAAAVIAATLSIAPGLAVAGPDSRVERSEKRIIDMHAKLKITNEQEALWTAVAQAMTENAQAMDVLTQARKDRAGQMTAVDDLKSYGEIADAHAAGIRKLTPVFASLYESMSPPQKVAADTLFRHGERMHRGHRNGPRNGSKMPDVK